MARGVNKVILIGNLGADPDVRAMPNGNTACSLRIATSEKWKDKETGEAKERTEWHSLSAFGKTAEIIGEYLKKGSKIYVEGSLRTRKWQDKEGNDRYTTEVIVQEMQMLDSRGQGESESTPSRRPAARRAPQQDHQTPDDAGFDDDVPM